MRTHGGDRRNVEFDAGAEGTRRVQGVAVGARRGFDRGVVFDAGAEGTKRAQGVVETELRGDVRDVRVDVGVEGRRRVGFSAHLEKTVSHRRGF